MRRRPPTSAGPTAAGKAEAGPKAARCPASCGRPDCCRMAAFHELDGKGRLVGEGFRCWLAGYQTGDIASWEIAFESYSAELGATGARQAIGDLGFWCRTLWHCRARQIEVFPPNCRLYCRDECLAIAMIGSLQYQRGDIARRCAAVLLGVETAPDTVIDMASMFAAGLDRLGVVLPKKVAVHAPIAA